VPPYTALQRETNKALKPQLNVRTNLYPPFYPLKYMLYSLYAEILAFAQGHLPLLVT
jgi:hypothetical protein